jgi:glycosyltransferase involved in cell wall biosynthesis
MGGRVLSALMFFPRGGSAHVARSLGRALPAHGWDVTVLSGSLPGHGDARAFYAGLDTHVVDFADPDVPMHPSYEDREGAPDPVFARVGDEAYAQHVAVWARALDRAGIAGADVLHLHHLTPIHEAAARIAPQTPVVGHLHGTELLMLEAIAEGPPAGWRHAEAWRQRMTRWAQRCERIVLLSDTALERAEAMLGVDPDRCVVLPNGFDPEAFHRLDVDRMAHWRRHLVDAPQGWRPGEGAGSVAYAAEDLERLEDATVLISVGRFTAVKRTDLLVRAFARAQERLRSKAALVIVGGHPGEWEGEHPAETVERHGAGGVFLAGWHGHDELPAFLSASDVLALASVREQFGQVLVEGMACGVPPIAVDRYGPGEIVEPSGDRPTGWLVEPDDEAGLADAIVAAVDDDEERRRRARNASEVARERWSWPALAGELAEVFDEVATERRGRGPARERPLAPGGPSPR